jgi:cytidyltransferase-like protein
MIIDIHNNNELGIFFDYCGRLVAEDKIIGLISGAFDLTHYYHVITLKRAKRLCDFLIVGVGTDRLVRTDKGLDRPVYPEEHRLEIVDSIKYVDACFLMDSEAEYGVIGRGLPGQSGAIYRHFVMFKNQDWLNRLPDIPGYSEGDYGLTGTLLRIYSERRIDIKNELYGNVIIIPDVDNTNSTTGFIKKIRSMET